MRRKSVGEEREFNNIETAKRRKDKNDNRFEIESEVLQSDEEEDEDGMNEDIRRQKTQGAIRLMEQYFSETRFTEMEVSELIEECYRVSDRVMNEEAAIEWSKDSEGIPFVLTDEVSKEDEVELKEVGGDLTKLVQRKQERLAIDRFSITRVHECVPIDYPEFNVLLDIAEGVELVVMENFEPSSTPRGPLRQSYLRVAPAVNKTLVKSHEEGLNIILPTNQVFGKSGVNVVHEHWVENYPKPEGRAITDSSKSRNMRTEEAVNSQEGKEKMKERWGELSFPTVADLTLMIIREADRVGWDKLILWKADIRSAYGQLFVRAKDAKLLVAELTNDKCVIHVTSNYGFTGTGYAFGPVSRVIKAVAGNEMAGGLEVYCDDFQGACGEDELVSEKCIAYGFTERLLGPRAFAGVGERDKYKSGRRMEWIGWEFDLDERVVGLASKNYNKTLYEFFNVNVNESVSLKTMERLAAFASRYSLIARPMRPFVHHLHVFKNMFNKNRDKAERRYLKPEAKLDIFMWRTFLIMMGLRRGEYWRKIESFAAQIITGLLKYDSSLTGLGLRLFRIRANGGLQLVRVASIITPYTLRRLSKFQNTMEFSSVAVGLLIMAEMGWRDIPLKIIGDSKASETWCVKERFRSTVARGAALMYMSLGVEFGFWVEETEFVRGEENKICDRLSRRSETDKGRGAKSATQLVEELGIDRKLLWEESKSPYGVEMIELCNPLLKLDDDASFNEFSKRMRTLISTIKTSQET